MKKECMFFLGNILSSLDGHVQQIKKLINLNLIGVIHDELHEGQDRAHTIIYCFESLTRVFRCFPDEAIKFTRIYGVDVFEKQQYS